MEVNRLFLDAKELRCILIVSVIFSLSFPPFPFGFLTPIAFFIFLQFMDDKTPRDSFRLGYWLGLIWGAMTLFWIAASTISGAILAIVINAFHYAIVWWIYAHFRKNQRVFALISLPFIWVGMEYLRLFTDIRFNWLTLAHTLTYYRPLIQIVELTGTAGLSFLIIVVSILLYATKLIRRDFRWIPILIIVLIISGLFTYGKIRIHHLENKSYHLIKAALVQPNVDPYQKWNPDFNQEAFEMLMKESRILKSHHPHLIVWPETATPFFLRTRLNALQKIGAFLDSTGIHLLTGTPDYEYDEKKDEFRTYNAAFFFSPKKNCFQKYYKIALVPVAESMPFKKYLPFLRKIEVGGGDFFPGREYSIFQFNLPLFNGRYYQGEYHVEDIDSTKNVIVKLSAIICYESIFSHIVREFVTRGANLLTIITNDGWFGLTSGPYQHAQFAVFRAIENRISIIRCANTGISGFIDPTGRYLDRAGLGIQKNLVTWLPLRNEETFYAQHGELFGKITLLVSFTFIFIKLIILNFFKRSRSRLKIKYD